MSFEAQLAPFTKIASVIYIIASIIEIRSANEILQAANDNQSNNTTPTTPNTNEPLELVIKSSKLFLTGNIIHFILASERLEHSKQEIKAGNKNVDITPDIYVTIGWILSIIGSSLRVYGHTLDLKESQSQ